MSPWHGRPTTGCAGPSPLLPNRTLRCGVEELLRARTAGAAAPRQGSSGTWGAFWRISAAGNGTGGLLRGAPVSRGSAGRLPQAAPARSEGLALPFPSLSWLGGCAWQRLPISATCQGSPRVATAAAFSSLEGSGQIAAGVPVVLVAEEGVLAPCPWSHPWCNCRRDLPAVPKATHALRVHAGPCCRLPATPQPCRQRGTAAGELRGGAAAGTRLPTAWGQRPRAAGSHHQLRAVLGAGGAVPGGVCAGRLPVAGQSCRRSLLAAPPWGLGVVLWVWTPSPSQVSSRGRGSLVQSQESSAGTPGLCRSEPPLSRPARSDRANGARSAVSACPAALGHPGAPVLGCLWASPRRLPPRCGPPARRAAAARSGAGVLAEERGLGTVPSPQSPPCCQLSAAPASPAARLGLARPPARPRAALPFRGAGAARAPPAGQVLGARRC